MKLLCINTGAIHKKNLYTGEVKKCLGRPHLRKGKVYTAEGTVISPCGHLAYNVVGLEHAWFIERFEEIDEPADMDTVKERISEIADKLEKIIKKIPR